MEERSDRQTRDMGQSFRPARDDREMRERMEEIQVSYDRGQEVLRARREA